MALGIFTSPLRAWLCIISQYSSRSQGIIVNYSLIRLQFHRASDAKRAQVTSKMPSRFAAVTNEEISQLIKQAVPEILEEGDEVRFGIFKALSF